jgi:hypothetical protein
LLESGKFVLPTLSGNVVSWTEEYLKSIVKFLTETKSKVRLEETKEDREIVIPSQGTSSGISFNFETKKRPISQKRK